MRSSITILALLLIQVFAFSASAEGVYKWKDQYGKTQYGDKPPKSVKTEQFKMPAITVIKNYGNQWSSSSVDSSYGEDSQSKRGSSGSNYSSLTIVAPKADQAIRANDGDVTLMIDIKPKLKKGHSIVVFLDGKQVSNGSSRAVNLPSLDRGLHQVRADVQDAYKKKIISSPAVSFTVLRHSVILNKNKRRSPALGIRVTPK